MIVESMNEYLDILSDHVYDNDKVVTYKWLSKELEVHVNIAKQVLWEFWQRHKKENNIECTVMLIGDLKSGGMRVEVVRESDLSTAKNKFTNIKSEHLYSIQKSIPDLESLALHDKGDIRFSAIKCTENNERSDEELSILRWGTSIKDNPVPKQEEKLKPKEKSEEAQVSETPEYNQASKKPANKKTTPISQKTGFNNLFGKVPNKDKSTSPSNSTDTKKKTLQEQNSSSKEDKSITNAKEEKKGLASFFGSNASATKDTHSKSPTSKEEQTNSNVQNNVKGNEKTKITFTKNNKKETRGVKRNRSKESKNIVKKRKRIVVNEDSGSEDEDMKSESAPESESEAEEEIVKDKKEKSPSPPRIIHNNGKARVLKVVDKTYEEDGFLVTKKVHVYESCSEDETDASEKQALKKQEPPSVPKVQAKKKQSTLTKFFKKP